MRKPALISGKLQARQATPAGLPEPFWFKTCLRDGKYWSRNRAQARCVFLATSFTDAFLDLFHHGFADSLISLPRGFPVVHAPRL
jgi:hypothetical protein